MVVWGWQFQRCEWGTSGGLCDTVYTSVQDPELGSENPEDVQLDDSRGQKVGPKFLDGYRTEPLRKVLTIHQTSVRLDKFDQAYHSIATKRHETCYVQRLRDGRELQYIRLQSAKLIISNDAREEDTETR